MKLKMLIISSFVFLLVGCNESSELELAANYPEAALKAAVTENEERDITVYGSHEINDELILIVFRGAMNSKDIWIADVHEEGGQWKVQELVQMNGPFAESADIQTVINNETFGYEVGYIHHNVTINGNLKIIEIDDNTDWKIWIKKTN